MALLKWAADLWNWMSDFWKHVLLVLLLTGATFQIHSYIFWGAGTDIDRWMEKSMPANAKTELPQETLFVKADEPLQPWAVRLQEQYKDVQGHSAMQLQAYIDMQKNYYAATLTWSFLAAIASLLGIFVIKDGWTDCNQYVRSAALTATLLMTFWQTFPKLLSLSANISAAKKSYLSCVQLGNELRSFAKQKRTPGKGQTEEELEADFINKADKRFSEIRNLNFDIDLNQGPDYKKAIQDQMKSQ